MTAARHRAFVPARRQRGVVMFVALIVLVAMALAALALIRSVDTTTAVVGNLGFRQASVLPSNAAVEEAVAALFEKNVIADKTKNLSAENYYATKQAGEDARGIPAQLQKKSSFSLGKVLKPDGGNEVRYVIERMCFKEEVAAITHCDMTLPAEGRGTTIEPGKDLSGALIQIPRPERYAIHKLIVSERRRAGDAAEKARKEEIQGVFLIRGDKAVFQKVDTGITGATDIEVLHGIKEGDEIITGSYKVIRTLTNDAKVKVDNAKTPVKTD